LGWGILSSHILIVFWMDRIVGSGRGVFLHWKHGAALVGSHRHPDLLLLYMGLSGSAAGGGGEGEGRGGEGRGEGRLGQSCIPVASLACI
jgi:hypothetical protein